MGNTSQPFIFTRQLLVKWAGERTVQNAEILLANGCVVSAHIDYPIIRGEIYWNSKLMKTGLTILNDGSVINNCPCWLNQEKALVCHHAIAIALSVMQNQKKNISHRSLYPTEIKITGYTSKKEDAFPSSLLILLKENWGKKLLAGVIPIQLRVLINDSIYSPDQIPDNIKIYFTESDEKIILLLESISAENLSSELSIPISEFLKILAIKKNSFIVLPDGTKALISSDALRLYITVKMDEESGEIVLNIKQPFQSNKPPVFIGDKSRLWIFTKDTFFPVIAPLPLAYNKLYTDGSWRIERNLVYKFLSEDLKIISQHHNIILDKNIHFITTKTADPEFYLFIQGSPVSFSPVLYARYQNYLIEAGQEYSSFGIPASDDVYLYYIRNLEAENNALKLLSSIGFNVNRQKKLEPIIGNETVLKFLGYSLPLLQDMGWKIKLKGSISGYLLNLNFIKPLIKIYFEKSTQRFNAEIKFQTKDGEILSETVILKSLLQCNPSVETSQGIYLLDIYKIKKILQIFEDSYGVEKKNNFSYSIHPVAVPYIDNAIKFIGDIQLKKDPKWENYSRQINTKSFYESLNLPSEITNILRPYQREGVSWLCFMRRAGLNALLADEMGLGKTIQVLAFLAIMKIQRRETYKTSLIVCPASIVENWAMESAKFFPSLRVCILNGPERFSLLSELNEYDIAIISYATLKKDISRLIDYQFDTVVLDEGQYIKNPVTQTAILSQKLKADFKIILTGTPVENRPADIWSQMQFLCPGYLGKLEEFLQKYEYPVKKNVSEANWILTRLHCKINPFILRRLRKDVINDLPPKIEKISICELTEEQITVYNEILLSLRKQIMDIVYCKGIARATVSIFALLTKLRLTCCHLKLVKPNNKFAHPSSKLELLMELLEEALCNHHKTLIFSQFVKVLNIIKEELDKRKISYVMLTGSTTNRIELVQRFNSMTNIPVFLISLRAGGTGLNLTAADTVFHFDPWWNPAVEVQATDRAYRIGQTKVVYSIKLITKNTVEEKILQLQQKKQFIADGIISKTRKEFSLSMEELDNLLRPL